MITGKDVLGLPTEGGNPAKHRMDVFICLTCTSKTPGPKAVLHQYDETPEWHWPLWGRAFNFGQQEDLYEYELRIAKKYTDAFSHFIMCRQMEDSLGIRDPDVAPLSARAFALTSEFISKRTDGTLYPMFAEEIADWLVEFRARFAFPASCLNIALHDGTTYKEVMTQSEALALCMFLQEKDLGAGSQLFTGKLALDLKGNEVSEKELEAQWDSVVTVLVGPSGGDTPTDVFFDDIDDPDEE